MCDSFFGQYGILMNTFCVVSVFSSNSQVGIIGSSLIPVKDSICFSINLFGYPAFWYFFLILLTSNSKEAMNTFHPNIKLTTEQNPTQFLDTQINRSNGTTSFSVVNKDTKLPFHWSSKVPIQYKRSVTKEELSQASRIATSFEFEVKRIKKKYQNAGYPKRFIEKQIESFTGIKKEPIIPNWLFEEKTETTQKVFIKISYCPKNESHIRKVIAKFNEFTNNKLQLDYTWKTTELRLLFRLKDKITHVSNVIYKGECSCGDTYIGKTKRNAVIRWKEHNSNNQKSEPSNNLVQNPDHEFNWSILARAPQDNRKRVILAYFITSQKPSLNDQKGIKSLFLFRNGIT